MASWTAPSAGTLAMNTFGSSFSPYIALYVGRSLATLQPVIANQNPFLFTVTAGTSTRSPLMGGIRGRATSSSTWILQPRSIE